MMTTIYTDASFDPELHICAWAYVIVGDNEETLVQTGHCKNCTNISGEIFAVVEALEGCRQLNDSIKLYCDYIHISKEYKKRKESRWRKLSKKTPAWSALWTCISDRHFRLTIKYIDHKANPAHKHAYSELKRVREMHKQRP